MDMPDSMVSHSVPPGTLPRGQETCYDLGDRPRGLPAIKGNPCGLVHTFDYLAGDGNSGRPLGKLRAWGLKTAQIHGEMKIGDRDTPGTGI
jgi:hypothetical protein